MRMKPLKRICFGLAVLLMAILTAATVLEKFFGTQLVAEKVYGAVWFICLWGVFALVAVLYILRRKLQRRPAAFLLHLAFVLILTGAFVTWKQGTRGTLHLRMGMAGTDLFLDSDGRETPLPFRVRLDDFRIDCYPGTRAPMDYVSRISLLTADGTVQGDVAMNKILHFRNYRFYQSSYDEDEAGTILSIAYDPWGIGITYAGYGLLLFSMIAFFFDPKSRFRQLLKYSAFKRTTWCLLFAAGALSAHAAEKPLPTLPRKVAGELGNLHVCYNDRICPLSTLAKDFTLKLFGKSRYKDFTPEQVLAGWLFYYDDWKLEPMIRIKSAEVCRRMGLEGRYARLTDFRDSYNAYVLQGISDRGVREADEKFNIVSMVCSGESLRIFPYNDPAGGVLRWASQVDDLPRDLPHEQWLFIRRAMNYVNELVIRKEYAEVVKVLQKIGAYQLKEAGEQLPSKWRFRCERLYNRLDCSLSVAVIFLLFGFGSFAYVCRCMIRRRSIGRRIRFLLFAGLCAGILYLTLTLGLRGFICGHWPLSNGYETMQFMAWCTLVLTFLLQARFPLSLSFGYVVSGLAMAVSVMGISNPQITPLMPVLNSPLLSVHVMLVMIAYSLLALIMCNGAAGILLWRKHRREAESLQAVGQLMLYPAVFCLAAGIFVGAVWANVSWGRYWGWDPKEVWALITLLVYGLALHADSLPKFRQPLFFHVFCVAAFLCVLITYFGVNFLLGGMHSYAGMG